MHSATLVYNLRIAETTKRQALDNEYRRPSTAAFTLVNQSSKRYDTTCLGYTGGLATLYYATESLHIQADFAAANVRQEKDSVKFSRTQIDDILLTAGYSCSLDDHTRITFSGMLGIPTHKDLSFEGIQFGTGHVGIGVQMDGSFFYAAHYQHFILAAARYLHFFSREVVITINKQDKKFRFTIGNAVDLFIAHNSNWGRHRLELGYNPTFVFEAAIQPNLDTVVDQTNYIRSSFFGSYRYLFFLGKSPCGIGVGLSYGFDHIPKDFGSKRIIAVWLGLSINF